MTSVVPPTPDAAATERMAPGSAATVASRVAPTVPSRVAPLVSSRFGPLRVGLVVAAAVLLLVPGPYVAGSFGDDALYVALGKAIAAGRGYRELFTLGQPPHLRYPPGLPVLLAGLWRAFGRVDAVLRAAVVANALAIGAAAGAIWAYGRRIGVAPLTLAIFALGPFFLDASLEYASVALSEPYMLLTWAVAVLLAERLGREERPRHALALALGVGLALGVAGLFRTQAVTLIPGFLIALLLLRQPVRRVALTALAAGAVCILPTLRTLLPADASDPLASESYFHYFVRASAASPLREALHQLAFNGRAYLGWFPPYFSATPLVGRLVVGSLLAAAVFGGARLARRRPELVWPALGFLVVIMAWPGMSDRLALPAVPFLGVMAAYRIDLEIARVPARWRRLPPLLLLAAAAAVGARQVQVRAEGRAGARTAGPWAYNAPSFLLPWTDGFIRASVARLERDVDPRLVVMVDRAPAIWLYAGRLTVPPDAGRVPVAPGEYLADRIRLGQVGVVVVGSPAFPSAVDVATLRDACPDLLEPVGGLDAFPPIYRVGRAPCPAFAIPDRAVPAAQERRGAAAPG